MYLNSLSKDIAQKKHHLFIDSARAVKDEIREDVKDNLEKEYKKAKGKSWILKLKNICVDSDFISDAITEWCFSYADKNRKLDKSYQIQTIAFSIMDSIISQDAVNRSKLNPIELKKITSRKTRYRVLRGLEVVKMDKEDRVAIGTALINIGLKSCIEKGSIYVFELFPVRNSMRLGFSEYFCEYVDNMDIGVSNNYFTKTPVYELENWKDYNTGGYIDKHVPLIKTENKQKYAIQKIPKSILSAVNTCQRVGFEVATDTINFVESIHCKNITELSLFGTSVKTDIGKLKSSWKKGKQNKYQLIDHYNRKNARLEKLNEIQGKFYQQSLTMRMVDSVISDGNRPFHYVYTLDFRGRMYANSSGLNVQGDKMSKNIVQFSRSTKLGKNGLNSLMYLISGLYDEKLKDGCKLSKASKNERISWSENNTELLVNIGNNPVAEIEYIKKAGEPLEFLNACIELSNIARWIDRGYDVEKYESKLIARLDATCSGSQAMSILLRDLELAQSVNVAYTGERVQDYYGRHVEIFEDFETYIEKLCLDQFKERGNFKKYHGIVNRKHFKRAVMTYGYSVSEKSGKDYIREELKLSKCINADDLELLTSELWQCVLIGAGATKLVMDWLQSCIKKLMKELGDGSFEFCWPCPAGLICYDIRRKPKHKIINTVLGGRRYQLKTKTAGRISNRKNITSISPNVVHSIDKSILMWVINSLRKKGCFNFAPIHDSIGVPLCNVFDVVDSVNEAHLKLYRMDYLNTLKEFWQERYNVILPPIPKPEKELKESDILNANNPFC